MLRKIYGINKITQQTGTKKNNLIHNDISEYLLSIKPSYKAGNSAKCLLRCMNVRVYLVILCFLK